MSAFFSHGVRWELCSYNPISSGVPVGSGGKRGPSTGVSNGVRAFREPGTKNARLTLTIIIGIVILLPAGIAYLSSVYHIAATPPGQPGCESVLSQMIAALA